MGKHNRFRTMAFAAIAVAAVLAPARAQDADDEQRGVARISLMNGEVSVRRGDAGEWVAGVINAPLMTDDRISTAPNSRAEVQFDANNLMRIGGNAEVHLAQISDGRYQLELAHGTMTWVVLRPNSANVEVDTPSVSVRPNQRGIYRISVDEAGETQVISRSGQVEVFTPRGSEWVPTAKMMIARGDPSNPEFQVVDAPPLDDWDRWNQDRDQRMLQSTSYQYVPQGVYGAEDLDQYGTWANVEPYGEVWRPTVSVGVDWAPYRSGRWVWEDWYGWTWVSYDPWGWAPYHYGRWFYADNFGWCWYPGVFGRRHYWSPALVAWFGWGGGGVGFGFGNIGWVPLAPYETFHPWWGRGFYGRGFGGRFNYTNINVTNVYRNSRFGGVSGMGYNDFNAGRFHGITRFSGNQIHEASLIRGQMPMSPGRNHLQFSDRAAAFTPRQSGNTRFFSQQRPTAVQRVPFEQQRAAFARGGQFGGANPAQAARGGSNPPLGNTRPQSAQGGNGWRGFGGEPGRGNPAPGMSGRSNPALGNSRPQGGGSNAPAAEGRSFGGNRNAGSQPAQNRGGWRSFGSPSGNAPVGRQFNGGLQAAPAAPQSRGSWGRFGEPGSNTRPPSATPRSEFQGGAGASPRYGAPAGVVRERPNYSAPSGRSYESPRYNAPSRSYESPRFSAPQQRSAPSFSAPQQRSAPSFSAPSRPSGGGGFSGNRGGGFSAPRSSGGGGSSRSSGGHGRR